MTDTVVPSRTEPAASVEPIRPNATRDRPRAPRLQALLPPTVVIALVIGAWELMTATGRVNKLILPTPWAVVIAFGHSWSPLWHNGLHTIIEAVAGFVLGTIIAVSLAVAFVHSELSRRVIYPLAMATQAVPIVAVAPVLVLWLGNGMEPKIFVAAFLVFFPTLVNMIRGLRSADGDVEELLHTLSADRWQRLVKVRLPASLPYLFTALKLAACSCFVGAVAAEWIGSNQGIGYLIVFDSSQFKIPEMWAAVVLGTLLSMAMYRLVVLAEQVSTPWLPRESDDY